jgi:hypothetical protein
VAHATPKKSLCKPSCKSPSLVRRGDIEDYSTDCSRCSMQLCCHSRCPGVASEITAAGHRPRAGLISGSDWTRVIASCDSARCDAVHQVHTACREETLKCKNVMQLLSRSQRLVPNQLTLAYRLPQSPATRQLRQTFHKQTAACDAQHTLSWCTLYPHKRLVVHCLIAPYATSLKRFFCMPAFVPQLSASSCPACQQRICP